jgi:glycosyltransferase involved in cell wall biosynthesis
MLIGIDDRTTKNQYKNRGIGNYTCHMVEWLPKVDPEVKIETGDFSRADIFLQPNFWDGFPSVSCPKVLMVHDLVPLATNRFSEKGVLANIVKGLLYRLKMRNIKKADVLLTNSENTKNDVIKYAGVDPKIVHRIYLGIDEEFRAQKPVPREERGNYILFVGGVEVNKNVRRLVEAFARIKNKESRMKDARLILPGDQFVNKDKIETKMIKTKVKELGLENDVEFSGFVPQKDLIELYRQALVFVYPSYYEGFGFPVLEAMACGTPVVTSNISSLPEVAGDAAILVDPYSVESITNGIKKILNSNTEQYQSWIEKGLAQSQKFSWRKCARETLGVLTRVRPDHRV